MKNDVGDSKKEREIDKTRQIDMLLMKYGVTLTLEQVAEVLHLAPGTLRNQRSAGVCVIPFYPEGKRLLADVRHVAEHLERRASEALSAATTTY